MLPNARVAGLIVAVTCVVALAVPMANAARTGCSATNVRPAVAKTCSWRMTQTTGITVAGVGSWDVLVKPASNAPYWCGPNGFPATVKLRQCSAAKGSVVILYVWLGAATAREKPI